MTTRKRGDEAAVEAAAEKYTNWHIGEQALVDGLGESRLDAAPGALGVVHRLAGAPQAEVWMEAGARRIDVAGREFVDLVGGNEHRLDL